MPLLSPIATVIRVGGGQTATITTPDEGDSSDYDPAATGDFVPGSPETGTVKGVYSDGRLAGLADEFTGLFRISATTPPNGLKAEKSKLTLNGVTYQVKQVRERVYRGVLDGYDLMLIR